VIVSIVVVVAVVVVVLVVEVVAVEEEEEEKEKEEEEEEDLAEVEARAAEYAHVLRGVHDDAECEFGCASCIVRTLLVVTTLSL
jgi:hypothetical protein